MTDHVEARAERRAVRRRGRLDAILAAAADVIRDVGYERLTLESVGESLGLSKQSLYYYVRSKDDLLAQLYASALARIIATTEAGVSPGIAPGDRLRHLVAEHIRFAATDPVGSALVALQELVLSNPDLVEVHESFHRYRAHVQRVISDGVEQGAFQVRDVELAGDVVAGAVYAAARRYASMGDEAPAEIADLADDVADLLLRGLERPGRAARRARSA